MRVSNNNLVYDDDSDDCFIKVERTQGYSFAFVQVMDLGPVGDRFKIAMLKRYWGLWDSKNKEQSVLNIIKTGGKWPDLEAM
ncbi:MAG: hypothetical protein V5786_00840 [Psychromonas sp.]